MKTFRIDPLGAEVDVQTATLLVDALLKKSEGRLKKVCGGKGICATCHVVVRRGHRSLSPIGEKERRTLKMLGGATADSRLACQAHVIGEGVVVDVPPGIYLEKLADVQALVGRRADEPLVHPITGQILVPAGKIITRSVIANLEKLDVISMLAQSEQVA